MNNRHNISENIYNTDAPKHNNDDICSYILDDENRDDSLYSLEDEDVLGQNTDNTVNESAAWGGEPSEKTSAKSPFALLFKTMATPVEGWKALKRARITDEKIASGLFYPVLAIASLSEFTGLFYETDFTLQDGVIRGLITFITFFFSYFCVMLLSDLVLPRGCREKVNSDFGKGYVMFNLTTLALFYIIFRIVPVMGPIFAFLPFWTIYMAVKGVKIFRVESEYKTRVAMTLCALILGCPILWNWIFTELIPLGNM